MATTNYFTEDGVINGQETGGVTTDYLADALGSVTATIDQNQSVINTYHYKPYGERLAKTGNGADPSFQWVGAWGYWSTGQTSASHFVRTRYLSDKDGRWTIIDRLHGHLRPYSYGSSNPCTKIDLLGLDDSYPGIRISQQTTPPGLQCYKTSPVGYTECNIGYGSIPPLGTTFSLVCCRERPCACYCTVIHELKHWEQYGNCCKFMSVCVNNAKGNYYIETECRKTFHEWKARNNDAFECLAYRADLDCFFNEYFSCLQQPWQGCKCYEDEIKISKDLERGYCKKPPVTTPCPFSPTGGIGG